MSALGSILLPILATLARVFANTTLSCYASQSVSGWDRPFYPIICDKNTMRNDTFSFFLQNLKLTQVDLQGASINLLFPPPHDNLHLEVKTNLYSKRLTQMQFVD